MISKFKRGLCSSFLASFLAMVSPSWAIQGATFSLPVSNANNDQIQFGLPGVAGVGGSVSLAGILDLNIETAMGGVTSIQFLGGTVSIADVEIEQEVQLFGSIPATMSVTFQGVSFDVSGGPFTVESELFPSQGLELNFNQGILTISITSNVLDPIQVVADLGAVPQSFFATGTLSSGPGQTSLVGTDFNLLLPILALTPPIPVGDFDVSFAFIGEISGTTSVVPEVSTIWQLSILGFVLLPVGYGAIGRRMNGAIARAS